MGRNLERLVKTSAPSLLWHLAQPHLSRTPKADSGNPLDAAAVNNAGGPRCFMNICLLQGGIHEGAACAHCCVPNPEINFKKPEQWKILEILLAKTFLGGFLNKTQRCMWRIPKTSRFCQVRWLQAFPLPPPWFPKEPR